MSARRAFPCFVMLMCFTSFTASAQQAPERHPWSTGTTLTLFSGAASTSSDIGPLVGFGLGWEVQPWLGIEGSGTWFDRPSGAEAFGASLNLRAAPFGGGQAKPFVLGGFGLYRASFDTSQAQLPAFYGRRLENSDSTLAHVHTFTDPAFMLGGGMNVFLSRHVALRPELAGTFVRHGSRSHVVTAFTVHLAYHFEDHPVTPVRTPR